MTEKLLQHGHCTVCNRAVVYGQQTCGEECKAKLGKEQKKRKTLLYVMYGGLVFFLLLLFVPNLLR